MSFLEYKACVLRNYQNRRDSGDLSINLRLASPAKIRQECLNALAAHTTTEDFITIRDFFGPIADKSAYEKAVRNTDIDKFRPVIKFMKGKVENTDEKNIELLAWLINFPKRPYRDQIFAIPEKSVDTELGATRILSPVELINTRGLGAEHATAEEIQSRRNVTGSGKPESKENTRQSFLIGVISLLVIGIAGFTVYKNSNSCMTWVNDHYESAVCEPQDPNSRLMNSYELNNLRKIIKWETISDEDIGKIHYSRRGRERSFFTTGGKDPENQNKHLEPMSRYMYDKYIRPLKNNPKVALESKKAP